MARDKWGFYGAAIFIALIVTLLNQKLVIEGLVANSDGTYCPDGFTYGDSGFGDKICLKGGGGTGPFTWLAGSTNACLDPGCIWRARTGYYTINNAIPPCFTGDMVFSLDPSKCVTPSTTDPALKMVSNTSATSPTNTTTATAPVATTASTTTPTATAATATDKKEWYEEPVNIGIMAVSGFVILMVLLTR